MITYVSAEELEAGLEHILLSPQDTGQLQLIVQRPEIGERQVVDKGILSTTHGLQGDNWLSRGSRTTDDRSANPQMQLNIMNIRVAQLVAKNWERVPLAGDQLYVDFDLSEKNLLIGSRIAIGTAEIEITAVPHLGCKKFKERFGTDAMRFVNSAIGRSLKLRGLNSRVTREGSIKPGDTLRRLTP